MKKLICLTILATSLISTNVSAGEKHSAFYSEKARDRVVSLFRERNTDEVIFVETLDAMQFWSLQAKGAMKNVLYKTYWDQIASRITENHSLTPYSLGFLVWLEFDCGVDPAGMIKGHEFGGL